jgi:hypothetical protein
MPLFRQLVLLGLRFLALVFRFVLASAFAVLFSGLKARLSP